MVVTRGIVYPHIKFAMSTLSDEDLWYNDGTPLELSSQKWKNFFADKKIPVSNVHFMTQVHGKDSSEVSEDSDQVIQNVDALITQTSGHFLAVKSADCLPIMLFDPKKNIVAAVHAGWKGTKAQILTYVLEDFVKRGSNIQDIHAILCPAIGACCYDVTNADDGRVEIFQKLYGENGVRKKDGKIFLDLRGANLKILKDAGVPEKQIVNMDECTVSGVMNLPSYYKDKTTKRFVSVIGLV